jgi:hypothetical protein
MRSRPGSVVLMATIAVVPSDLVAAGVVEVVDGLAASNGADEVAFGVVAESLGVPVDRAARAAASLPRPTASSGSTTRNDSHSMWTG